MNCFMSWRVFFNRWKISMVLIHNPRCRSNLIYHSWDCCKLGCWEGRYAQLSFQVNRLNWIKNRDIIPDVAGGAVGVISLTSSSMVESSTVSTSATLVMASYDGGSLGFWNLKHNACNFSSDACGFDFFSYHPNLAISPLWLKRFILGAWFRHCCYINLLAALQLLGWC